MSRQHADIWSPPGDYLVDPYTWPSNHFWLRYSKFHSWPWKFKVKVMAKVKPDGDIWGLKFNLYVCFSLRGNRTIFGKVTPNGRIWGLEFNRYVCFSFRGIQTIFGRDIANSMFDLENSRSRSWPRSNPMVAFEAQSSIDVFGFCFVAIGPFLAEI